MSWPVLRSTLVSWPIKSSQIPSGPIDAVRGWLSTAVSGISRNLSFAKASMQCTDLERCNAPPKTIVCIAKIYCLCCQKMLYQPVTRRKGAFWALDCLQTSENSLRRTRFWTVRLEPRAHGAESVRSRTWGRSRALGPGPVPPRPPARWAQAVSTVGVVSHTHSPGPRHLLSRISSSSRVHITSSESDTLGNQNLKTRTTAAAGHRLPAAAAEFGGVGLRLWKLSRLSRLESL
jgi:hypothetical protein